MDIQKELFALQDLSYREFHARLMPTVPKENIIGVRTPMLRRLSRQLSPSDASAFLSELPHHFYEENNVHACLISSCKDFDTALSLTEDFLPFIDNWATCDMFFPKIFEKNADLLLPHIRKWIQDKHAYTVRFSIGLLMRLFLETRFSPEYLSLVSDIPQNDYYVYMMTAWFFSVALVKQYDATLPFLLEYRLPRLTHNKTIQKALESYRIPTKTKAYLRTLRR